MLKEIFTLSLVSAIMYVAVSFFLLGLSSLFFWMKLVLAAVIIILLAFALLCMGVYTFVNSGATEDEHQEN